MSNITVSDDTVIEQINRGNPEIAARLKPMPFHRSALATFCQGSEEVVAVKFTFATGFDEKLHSRIKLHDQDQRARFIVLFPPPEIQFFDNGRWRTRTTKLAGEKPKQIWHADLDAYYVPVIELDTAVNPLDSSVAMVYPADDYTLKLFQPQGRIDDSGLLTNYALDLVRFVKPNNMSVIQDLNPPRF